MLNEQGILAAVFCPLNRQTCFKRANFVSSHKKERLAKAVCHSPQHVLCDPFNQRAVYLMNFYLKRSVKQQAHYISQISSRLSKPCDLGSKPQVLWHWILESCEIWESSRENWDARYCQLTFEQYCITCWHDALVLMFTWNASKIKTFYSSVHKLDLIPKYTD